jgi:hypothetical protein
VAIVLKQNPKCERTQAIEIHAEPPKKTKTFICFYLFFFVRMREVVFVPTMVPSFKFIFLRAQHTTFVVMRQPNPDFLT